jgi:hypothetical protein
MNKPEYLYRFRYWYSNNVWWGGRSKEITDEQIAGAWGDWEIIDEAKYNDIVHHITSNNCHYQAQKLRLDMIEDSACNPRDWINKKIEDQEREERHLNGRQRKTIYLAKVTQPDGTVSPWMTITARVFEHETFAAKVNRKYVKVLAAQEHYGSWYEYMYEGILMQAFEFHPDYADQER